MSEKKRFSYSASEAFGSSGDGFDDDILTEELPEEPQERSRREREFDEAAARRAERLKQYTMKRDCENEYYNTYGYSRRTARPRYAAAVPEDAAENEAATPQAEPTASPMTDDFDDFGDIAEAAVAAAAAAPLTDDMPSESDAVSDTEPVSAPPLKDVPEDGGLYDIDGEIAMFDMPEPSDNKDFPLPEQVHHDRAGAIITVIIVLLLIAFMFYEATQYFPQFDRGLRSCADEITSTGEPDSFDGNAFVSDADSLFSY